MRSKMRTFLACLVVALAGGPAIAQSGEALYEEGQAAYARKDLPAATGAWNKACELEHARGCFMAGQAAIGVSIGKTGEENIGDKGVILLDKACTKGLADSCELLAKVYREGLAVPANPTLATVYTMKTCVTDPGRSYCGGSARSQ